MALRVDQQVLGLDVAVADADQVDVMQRAAHLVHIQLHKERGHVLPHLGVVLADAVHRVGDVLQHQVEVHLLLLRGGVERVLQAHHVGVVHHLHDLELAVLEPLVLQHLLNRHHLVGLQAVGLEDHAKGAVPHHAVRRVVDGAFVRARASGGGDDVAAAVGVALHYAALKHQLLPIFVLCDLVILQAELLKHPLNLLVLCLARGAGGLHLFARRRDPAAGGRRSARPPVAPGCLTA
mmetsp:Transcript_34320/g.87763  ORF Transcript_34320/g.87763 Transcript_34320/m.87763 type:complete len:236 (+) Transcript_34320:740-1447(+)